MENYLLKALVSLPKGPKMFILAFLEGDLIARLRMLNRDFNKLILSFIEMLGFHKRPALVNNFAQLKSEEMFFELDFSEKLMRISSSLFNEEHLPLQNSTENPVMLNIFGAAQCILWD